MSKGVTDGRLNSSMRRSGVCALHPLQESLPQFKLVEPFWIHVCHHNLRSMSRRFWHHVPVPQHPGSPKHAWCSHWRSHWFDRYDFPLIIVAGPPDNLTSLLNFSPIRAQLRNHSLGWRTKWPSTFPAILLETIISKAEEKITKRPKENVHGI